MTEAEWGEVRSTPPRLGGEAGRRGKKGVENVVAGKCFKNEKASPLLEGFAWLSFHSSALPAHLPECLSEGILLLTVGFKEGRNFASVLLLGST